MKTPLLTVLACSAALGLWACGKSICSRADEVNDGLEVKAKDCAQADGGGIKVGGHIAESACESGTKSCTSGDTTIMNKQLDCLDKLDSCVKGKENEWIGQVAACSTDVSKVTAACLTALTPAE